MRAPLSSGCVLTLRAQQGKAHRCYHRNQSSFDLWWYEQEEAGWRVDTWCWWAATCAVCVWWAICNVQPLSSVCFSYILQLASIRVRLLYMYEEETIMQTWGFFYFFTIFPIISIWLMFSLSPEKNLWYAVTMQALLPLPRSLHMAVLIRKRVFSFGGLAPAISEDSSVPDHETKWILLSVSTWVSLLHVAGLHLHQLCVCTLISPFQLL